MNKPFWPLAINSWGQRERDAAMAVIDSGNFTMGSKVREFEAAFANHVGSRYAVMVNSGSSANLLAVAVMHYVLGFEDPWYRDAGLAIVPAIAWSTTYAPFAQHGYQLAVCDVDPKTLNVDMSQVQQAIDKAHTKNIIVVGVSILGTPAPLNELRTVLYPQNPILRDMGAPTPVSVLRSMFPHRLFLEDNCESLGAKINGKQCGTFGDMGTFSFFFSHHLNTGEGGMLVTDNREIYELAVCMRAHGWVRDLPANSTLRPFTDSPNDYQFVLPGYNVRPTELAAAVGLVQLDRLPNMESERKANADVFHSLFQNDERWVTQPYNTHAVPYGFTLVFRTKEEKRAVEEALDEAHIEHRLITGGSFGKHEAAARYDWAYANVGGSPFSLGGTPNADHIHDCGLFVGNHPVDLTKQIYRLRDILEEVMRRVIK